ncbi:phosphoribosyl-dephospho- transferase [Novosphingobium sp. Rr 2-17]|uniref:malonate decarboxylase holo-[acyl-carrier-protein] synthase n=1 Tax=Novosphingobium sp. Rr 2-17 TaxID=555793 RepID=UPI00026998E0|nr:malonate decarboxylase holo-[acyl-carrier-protein] synthase [Novosphingobium sp. Rr 2-17]EIZ77394.1 phosphoribosyl-dephospho- transferase [Novosphingobium sp. Rr 2-17]
MAESRIARHTLAYVAPDAWREMVAGETDTVLLNWAASGWPAIVRRPDCSDSGNSVPLGVPLPPAMGKRRVALRCQAEAIEQTRGLPSLRDAAASAPNSWQIDIATVLMLAPDAACYGSLAWSHLTGLAYLSDTSDLDLALACADADEADRLAAGLSTIAACAKMGIDAELIAPSGAAVQWREWHSVAPEVVVKSMAGAELVDRGSVFA